MQKFSLPRYKPKERAVQYVIPAAAYANTKRYVTMKMGHFQPLVSRRVTAIVEMHCGANTNQARKASAVASDQSAASFGPRLVAAASSAGGSSGGGNNWGAGGGGSAGGSSGFGGGDFDNDLDDDVPF